MKSEFTENLKEVSLAILVATVVVILQQVFLVSLPWEKFARFLIETGKVLLGLLFFFQSVKIDLLSMGQAVGLGIVSVMGERSSSSDCFGLSP